MTCRKSMHLGSLMAAAIVALGLTVQGYAQAPPAGRIAFELCIEQSPAQAGKLSPGSGTHHFSADSIVTLSAEPQPGYEFAYWLGDVADPQSQRTTVQVNSSKVVVAVFQPAPQEYPKQEFLGGGGGGGGGAAVPTTMDLSSPGWHLAGGGRVRAETVVVPVPVPVPVPEPATLALLALGVLSLRRRK